jgi:Tol biopolymer transport system component
MGRIAALVAVLAAAVAVGIPAAAQAACSVPLPGDDATLDETSCGAIDTSPPPAGSGGGSGSSSAPNIILWASGYDVNPFDGRRGGIWISRFDGSGRRQLTQFADHNPDFQPHGLNLPDDHPSFSPDSRKIAFTSNRANGTDWDVYVMNANGSGVTRLAPANGLDSEPVFSPDGTKIAFETQRFGNTDIAVMNANGTNVQRLTANGLEDIEPAWSPDGTKIAFARLFSAHEKEIFVMNADGSGERRVTFVAGEDHDPTWSPDGTRLAITSERPPNSPPFGNVHIIRVSDGADLADMTADLDFGAGDPFWSHDGSVIAFFKSVLPTLGPMNLFVMSATTGAKLHVPGEASVNVHPAIGRAVDDDGDGTPNYLESGSVGRARLTPRTIATGRTATLTFDWTHPRAWRRLTTLYVGLADGTRTLGIVRHAVAQRSFALYDLRARDYDAAQRHGILRAGALTLDLDRTRIEPLSRTTLRLRLAIRLPHSLAGKRLRVGVQALARDGSNQAEHLPALRTSHF